MKNGELRIGNLVYFFKDTPATVMAISNKQIYLSQGNGFISPDIEEIEPIQLTEEWFERFMLFKLTIKSDRWYNEDKWVFSFNSKIQCGEFFITTNDFLNFNFYIATIDDGIESWEYITEFKHVHQLQNLYFALTGEELITK